MTGLVDIAVENDAAANRFVARVDGQTAELQYERFPDRIVLVHTEVPAALRGRGIADKLAHTALEYARAEHLRVVPRCPFVAAYLRRHPEYQDLLLRTP